LKDVTCDQGGAIEPTGDAKGCQIGDQVEITVAASPVGESITRRRVHLHIGGEQVVAGVRAGLRVAFEEEAGVEALAELTAVDVGEGQQDGLDLGVVYAAAKIFDGEHSGDLHTEGRSSAAGSCAEMKTFWTRQVQENQGARGCSRGRCL
jgi:hypothetical protein